MKLENVPTIRDLLDIAPEKHNDRVFIKYIRDGQIVEKRFSEVRSDGLAVCRKLRRDIPGSTAFVPSVVGLIIAGEVIKDICRA